MICLPCKGCGADLGYGDQWPWGDPFLPSKPYVRGGSVWCRVCYNMAMSLVPAFLATAGDHPVRLGERA